VTLIMIDWTYLATHELFAIAKQAYRRCSGQPPGLDSGQDALVAVLFSAATLEAFMSQAVHAAEQWAHLHPRIKAFADFLAELDEREVGASLKAKYNMAHWVLCGQPFDKGRSPYQDFDLLVDLRNLVIHLKPDSTAAERTKKLLRRLQSAHLIPVGLVPDLQTESPDNRTHWLHYACNPVVAKWACTTAAEMIHAFWRGAQEQDVWHVFEHHANAAHFTAADL
jgi:hypothetical protein